MQSEQATAVANAPTCRICDTHLLNRIVCLPEMPLTDDFVQVNALDRTEFTSDINIYQCDSCGIVQNPADFDYIGYYRDYQYSSGHSEFTRQFMLSYARATIRSFTEANGRPPDRVVEAGSGDGAQLKCFLENGLQSVTGIEPSEYLANIANESGITTTVALFDRRLLDIKLGQFDICLSSYTFDHVRNPFEYLQVANALLVEGGVLAIEVHDLEKIVQRAEFCLFEHEHTIYLNACDLAWMVEKTGFRVLATNPLPADQVRGNSLVLLATKVGPANTKMPYRFTDHAAVQGLSEHIESLKGRIDHWIKSIPEGSRLVGFGAGGRGVMTLAGLLYDSRRFQALFDSNYESNTYVTPKTRVPIVGPAEWAAYSNSYCLVFSFGYLNEITKSLVNAGFDSGKIVSLLDFY